MLLLQIVFISTNVAVLVLRKDHVDKDHFRVATIVPVLGVLSCVLLLTQQSAGTWLRAETLPTGAPLRLVTRLVSRARPPETGTWAA